MVNFGRHKCVGTIQSELYQQSGFRHVLPLQEQQTLTGGKFPIILYAPRSFRVL